MGRKKKMNILIEVWENELPYNNGNSYPAHITINGKWFKEVIVESNNFKDMIDCVAHSLSNDPDFKFKTK